ncbi:VOC family protein [Asanoa sp. WMMD1127]|uniref:VOC family protein n=1 Tax=Asanoa sp. WMMD1127 TaxID=3016107 RepID=UPI002416F0D6|nr:VOC family protein [Asanoa sp. WMMD1127]MDG4820433.1 VOC family protein [Asanoa sp. WMMD1127]
MTTRMQITIDCAEPTALARFWATALHYDPAPPPSGFASWHAWYRSVGVPEEELAGQPDEPDRIVDPAGVGPKFWFQRVPEPKTVKNRVHLDLDVSKGRGQPLEERRAVVESEVERLRAAGASVFRVLDDPANSYFAVVLQDPEGNEFCVC